MELTGPRPRPLLAPCQFTVTVSSLQFSVWQFSTSSTRAAQQHFEQMVQQFLLMPQYFCLSSAEDTTKWKRIYTQSVAGHRILDSTADSTPAYNVQRTRRVCIKKHDMARAISFVFLFLLCSYLCSFCFCAPLPPSFPFFLASLLLSFFGLRPNIFFSIFFCALSKILCYSQTKTFVAFSPVARNGGEAEKMREGEHKKWGEP